MNCTKMKVLTLAGAIANLSLSCAVARVTTSSWFNKNRDEYADDVSIWAEGPEILSNYQVLRYDEYIKERNVYSNIVIRAELTFVLVVDTSLKEIEIDILKAFRSALLYEKK